MNGSTKKTVRIAAIAPGVAIEQALAERAQRLVRDLYPENVELVFHDQCFETQGHFAGSDASRLDALIEVANDPEFDAVWFARGGYGSCRIAQLAVARMNDHARSKSWLGYSDMGFLLAGLDVAGFEDIAHGPMPVDLIRPGGEEAFIRGLKWLVEADRTGVEDTVASDVDQPALAFNLTILSHVVGTPLEPDCTDRILMLEDVGEYMYRIDRALFTVTANASVRRCKGIRLGRVSEVLPNAPAFVQTEEDVVRYWCETSGIAYLGRADIGHDPQNKIVPFKRV